MEKRPMWVRREVLGWGGLVLGVGLLGGWALSRILGAPTDALEAPGYTVVVAETGTVGQTLRLNTSAAWPAEAEFANQAVGTVTSVVVEGAALVSSGAPLYTVDLRPVVVASGSVPAFRDLSTGARGADVAQLQGMLTTLGYSPGLSDGVYDSAVASAVRAWQRDLGVAADGVVHRGDVVFVPELPARLALAPAVSVGAVLSGGEPAVMVLPAVPVFSIAMPEGQSRLVSAGMRVDINNGSGSWSAVIGAVTTGTSGTYTAELHGVDDTPICAEDCALIPYRDGVLLPSVIHVVPEVEGIVVPAAAVVNRADEGVGVVLESGDFRPVTVVAGASGLVVVEGIDEGTRVRVPGESTS